MYPIGFFGILKILVSSLWSVSDSWKPSFTVCYRGGLRFHSFGEEVLDSFASLSNDFNKLDRLGKSRLLPYLLHWLTKRDVKYYISVVGKESLYTKNQATIIDRFNLLPEKKRRAMFPKVAAYFILLDIDYRVIEDDNWQSPFIQRVAS